MASPIHSYNTTVATSSSMFRSTSADDVKEHRDHFASLVT